MVRRVIQTRTRIDEKEFTYGDHHTPLPYRRTVITGNDPLLFEGRTVLIPVERCVMYFPTLILKSDSGVRTIEQLKRNNFRARITNNALEKLDDEFNTATSLFEDWYERKQSINMAIAAANKLLEFLQGWRKPSYWRKIAKGAKAPSNLPDAWLTYNFGIKPLIGTIDHCMNRLGREFPKYTAKATASGSYRSFYGEDPTHESTFWADIEYGISCGARAYAYNPNTALAGITGLNQPFSSVASVVAWGWALEYFVNVSQMLSNVEEKHPGLRFDRGWTTNRVKGDWRWIAQTSSETYGKTPTYATYGDLLHIERVLGTPRYSLELSLPLLGSGKLANLTSAIALTMKGKKNA